MRRQSNTRAPKQFGNYIIGKTLGQGTFGKVKSAIHKPTGQQVAIKILQKSKITQVSDVQRVSREIHILKIIRHPHIVQLYQIIQTPKQIFLIMQYMQKGQLFNYIVDSKRINQSQAALLFHQLVSGIQYIHKIGIAHRDLKPQNILLDSKNNLRIVDFGLGNTYKKGQLLKTPCGSPCYAAPEMIKGQRYDGLRVDIWSCGVILFAMLCGYLPFQDDDTPSLYRKILSGTYSLHKSVSQSGRDLISKILNGNQNQRYTIQQIRNHPWMSKQKISISDGIVVGYNKIPIDKSVLNNMKNNGLDIDYVSKCLQANRHNNVTTWYYLSLKQYISEGGSSEFDIHSKSFDKSIIEPNRRKNTTINNVIIDNFFTKSTQTEVVRKKSKQKSREKVDNKQNKMLNINTMITNGDSKKIRNNSKNKINQSFNYGRLTVNRSIQKSIGKRQSNIDNRISRKFKQNFNQSLISKSKQKCTQRSRVNSSINGMRKQLNNLIIQDKTKSKKIKSNQHNISKIQIHKNQNKMKVRRM